MSNFMEKFWETCKKDKKKKESDSFLHYLVQEEQERIGGEKQ